MGLIGGMLELLFGGGRNVVKETVEVFAENAEAGAGRARDVQSQAMTQFGAEFGLVRKGWFDRLMDGLNRLPRPALALGTLGLFVTAMTDPLWFAERMQGLALVPDPLWWLLGVIVSFYFGARHQAKAQEFQRDLAVTVAGASQALRNVTSIRALRADTPGTAATETDAPLTLAAVHPEENRALDDWRALHPA